MADGAHLAILAFWHHGDAGEVTKALVANAPEQFKAAPGLAVSLVIPPDDPDFAAICYKLDLEELVGWPPAPANQQGRDSR